MTKEQGLAIRVTTTQADKLTAYYLACLPLAHAEMMERRRGLAIRVGDEAEKIDDVEVAERAARMSATMIEYILKRQEKK